MLVNGDFTLEDGVFTAYNGSGGDVVIPDGVTSIGNCAFCNKSITSVTVPSSVTGIGASAFYYCSSLTSVNIPSCITSIERDAFDDCNNLTDVYYEGSKEQWNMIRTNRPITFHGIIGGSGAGNIDIDSLSLRGAAPLATSIF